MNRVTQQAAQGDVLFIRRDALPDGLSRVDRDGDAVVAHSETGHHHVVRDPHVVMFEPPNDPLVCYLMNEIGGEFEVTHLRSFDTHAPLLLDGGPGAVWEVRRQREHTPEGWRRVED